MARNAKCGGLKVSRSVFFETLGCAKNQVDTEVMVGILAENHFEIVATADEADIIVVNTCGFIESAKEESLNTIFELLEYKKNGKCSFFAVAGCLAQRYGLDLENEIPEVDAFIGTTKFEEILTILEGKRLAETSPFTMGSGHLYMDSIDKELSEDMPRVLSTPDHYAFLKIAEGCDNLCTYCIIPKLRGKYRSRKREDILREAHSLADQGVKELIVIAQDTTQYGIDLYGELLLPELLKDLASVEGIRWIRLQYCYPESITDALIDVIANEPKVVKYIDIPIQHASDAVLKRMNRRTNQSQLTETLNKLRTRVPGIAIRTTLIAGFPGETQDDFDQLLAFVKAQRFEKLGVFAYSLEEDTAAAKLDGHLELSVREERRDQILEVQMVISQEIMYAYMGRELDVVIEESVPGESIYVGRSQYDTPEVDGVVYVHTNQTLNLGDFVQVRVTDALEYDLIAEQI